MSLREYLIKNQGTDLPGYFIMVQTTNPEPIEVTRTFNHSDLVEGDWMNTTLNLIKIKLIDADLYELVPRIHYNNFNNKDQKIPVCIKR